MYRVPQMIMAYSAGGTNILIAHPAPNIPLPLNITLYSLDIKELC